MATTDLETIQREVAENRLESFKLGLEIKQNEMLRMRESNAYADLKALYGRKRKQLGMELTDPSLDKDHLSLINDFSKGIQNEFGGALDQLSPERRKDFENFLEDDLTDLQVKGLGLSRKKEKQRMDDRESLDELQYQDSLEKGIFDSGLRDKLRSTYAERRSLGLDTEEEEKFKLSKLEGIEANYKFQALGKELSEIKLDQGDDKALEYLKSVKEGPLYAQLDLKQKTKINDMMVQLKKETELNKSTSARENRTLYIEAKKGFFLGQTKLSDLDKYTSKALTTYDQAIAAERDVNKRNKLKKEKRGVEIDSLVNVDFLKNSVDYSRAGFSLEKIGERVLGKGKYKSKDGRITEDGLMVNSIVSSLRSRYGNFQTEKGLNNFFQDVAQISHTNKDEGGELFFKDLSLVGKNSNNNFNEEILGVLPQLNEEFSTPQFMKESGEVKGVLQIAKMRSYTKGDSTVNLSEKETSKVYDYALELYSKESRAAGLFVRYLDKQGIVLSQADNFEPLKAAIHYVSESGDTTFLTNSKAALELLNSTDKKRAANAQKVYKNYQKGWQESFTREDYDSQIPGAAGSYENFIFTAALASAGQSLAENEYGAEIKSKDIEDVAQITGGGEFLARAQRMRTNIGNGNYSVNKKVFGDISDGLKVMNNSTSGSLTGDTNYYSEEGPVIDPGYVRTADTLLAAGEGGLTSNRNRKNLVMINGYYYRKDEGGNLIPHKIEGWHAHLTPDQMREYNELMPKHRGIVESAANNYEQIKEGITNITPQGFKDFISNDSVAGKAVGGAYSVLRSNIAMLLAARETTRDAYKTVVKRLNPLSDYKRVHTSDRTLNWIVQNAPSDEVKNVLKNHYYSDKVRDISQQYGELVATVNEVSSFSGKYIDETKAMNQQLVGRPVGKDNTYYVLKDGDNSVVDNPNTIAKVRDGDTLEVSLNPKIPVRIRSLAGGGNIMAVRLAGVDVSESSTVEGKLVTQALEEKLAGKDVKKIELVGPVRLGKYGRVVGDIRINGKELVSDWLVGKGYATRRTYAR